MVPKRAIGYRVRLHLKRRMRLNMRIPLKLDSFGLEYALNRKRLRLSEQHFPIYKWNPGGLSVRRCTNLIQPMRGAHSLGRFGCAPQAAPLSASSMTLSGPPE
jgi:hypothetical protein